MKVREIITTNNREVFLFSFSKYTCLLLVLRLVFSYLVFSHIVKISDSSKFSFVLIPDPIFFPNNNFTSSLFAFF